MKRVIKEKDLLELLRCYYLYAALKLGGVDNWEWYGDSISQFLEENECEDITEFANKYIDVWAQPIH